MVVVPDLSYTDARCLAPPVPYEFQGFVDEGFAVQPDGVGPGGVVQPDGVGPGGVVQPDGVQAVGPGVAGAVQPDGVQAVGRPGKIGIADVELKRDASGRTGLGRRYVKAPMSLSKPLHVDPVDPHTAVVYVRSTGGGIAQNDRIRQRFVLQPGAQALVTTQAATAVHRMNRGFGTQWTSCFVGDGAVLEYFPGHTTLFGGSRFVQLTEFELSASAALIAGEVVMLGRLASGECHKFRACSITTRVTRGGVEEGRKRTSVVERFAGGGGHSADVLLNDRILAESRHDNANTQLFDRWPIWASLVVVPPLGEHRNANAESGGRGEPTDPSVVAHPAVAPRQADVKALVDELHQLGQQLVEEAESEANTDQHEVLTSDSAGGAVGSTLAIGASLLAKNSGAMVRIAGDNMDQVRHAMDAIHSAARQRLLGKPSFDLRRM